MNNIPPTPPSQLSNFQTKVRSNTEKPRIKVTHIFPHTTNDQGKPRLSIEHMHVRKATGYPEQQVTKKD